MTDGIAPGLDPDPFAALTNDERAAAAATPSGSGDDAHTLDIQTCPEREPPPHRFHHWVHGEPSGAWLYRDAHAALLCAMARYNLFNEDGSPKLKENGKQAKQFSPWCYGRRQWTDRDGKARDRTGWHAKAPPTPRPLYGLDRLAARPAAPVIITEGEKAADRAEVRFPDHVAISSMNGANAPGKSDWSPLQGRTATIWPDNDASGANFAAAVANLANEAGAEMVRSVETPPDWPEGWDLADDPPDGVTPDQLRMLLDDAPDGAAASFPPEYRMTPKGLFFYPEPTDRNLTPVPVFVSAPFCIVGETRSVTGEAWGLLLRWRDRDGRLHQWAIPRRLIHRPGNEIAEELEHAGLSCGSNGAAHDKLKRFIGAVEVARRLRCVNRTGWHQGEFAPVFVLHGGDAFWLTTCRVAQTGRCETLRAGLR
ncbi:DUF927 domain-containing protein [Rhodopila sp.]|uniref:DUF927 domain-containing protein n=1 Tax=Rhodopila sp. TaxID=2480087 RepID=UPI003D14A588